jgi:hypothetical protein
VKGTQSIAIELKNATTYGASLSDDYSYYKLFQTPRSGGPQSILSTEEFDIGNLRYFTVLSEEGRVYSYNFPQGSWFAPSAPVAGADSFVTTTPSGQTGLFVVTREGGIVPFDPRGRRFGSPLAERWPADSAAFVKVANTTYRLAADGQVRDAATGEMVEALSSYRFTDLVSVPLYDAFEVAP